MRRIIEYEFRPDTYNGDTIHIHGLKRVLCAKFVGGAYKLYAEMDPNGTELTTVRVWTMTPSTDIPDADPELIYLDTVYYVQNYYNAGSAAGNEEVVEFIYTDFKNPGETISWPDGPELG